ncbi:hypothetical protein [Candidatus Binatus sp.]|uniref:hypothetical protein n=1 Tax=Candidatus Binatus sp. TaxID=2811406 RepID=UPI003C47B055
MLSLAAIGSMSAVPKTTLPLFPAGSQQTLVAGSQNISAPDGSPGRVFGKLARIRIEPSVSEFIPAAASPTGSSANWVVMLRVNRPSAVTGHPQQACIAWLASKT